MSTGEPNDEAANVSRHNNIEKYSVFTTAEKWCIVIMASCAAWFSTMSSFIYYPAIPTLAKTLGTSVNKINLTVTTYMSVAAIAPALVGDAADILGRRPVYMLTLSIYFVANLAIALSQTYSALLGLRLLQALAISGTFSIAYGVITDIAPPAQRGSFAALLSFAITIAPSIGPILGGTLTFVADWTWIFWFLCIVSGSCLAMMILFLPETSRQIVADGSIKPCKYLRLPVPGIMRHWQSDSAIEAYKLRIPNPFRSLTILMRRDNAIIILGGGLLYVVYTCINASLSTLLVSIYALNEWKTGLIYLPFGVGGMVSTFISGRLLDRAWRDAQIEQNLPTDNALGDDLDSFPIEKARLRIFWIPILVTFCATTAFGWVLQYRKHIAIPLALQFVAGLCMQLEFSIYNTLLVDKNHRTPAAAQASSNIVRCTLAAVFVSFFQDIIDVIGIGWTFSFMGGLCLLATSLFCVDYHKGTLWRRERINFL